MIFYINYNEPTTVKTIVQQSTEFEDSAVLKMFEWHFSAKFNILLAPYRNLYNLINKADRKNYIKHQRFNLLWEASDVSYIALLTLLIVSYFVSLQSQTSLRFIGNWSDQHKIVHMCDKNTIMNTPSWQWKVVMAAACCGDAHFCSRTSEAGLVDGKMDEDECSTNWDWIVQTEIHYTELRLFYKEEF